MAPALAGEPVATCGEPSSKSASVRGAFRNVPSREASSIFRAWRGISTPIPNIMAAREKLFCWWPRKSFHRLRERGYPLFYGALGENLTTRDIDVRLLKPGDRLRAGAACLEITQPRIPCSQLDIYGPAIKGEIFDRHVKAGDCSSPYWGMSGLYAAVREPGLVRPGDAIEVLEQAVARAVKPAEPRAISAFLAARGRRSHCRIH